MSENKKKKNRKPKKKFDPNKKTYVDVWLEFFENYGKDHS